MNGHFVILPLVFCTEKRAYFRVEYTTNYKNGIHHVFCPYLYNSLIFFSKSVFSTIKQRTTTITSPLTSPIRQAAQNMYEEKTSQHEAKAKRSLKDKLLSWRLLRDLCDKVCKHTIVRTIFSSNANYKTEQLFIDSFVVTNALKALSNLAVASYVEDEYGIVQQTLPDILNAFVGLQKMLEKFAQAHISFKTIQRADSAGHVQLLIQKLAFILDESIHKVVKTFGGTLKSLALSDEVIKRLERYYF